MPADPTTSIYGLRGVTTGGVGTDDIADGAITSGKMAAASVSGATIADLGVNAGKLNLGAVSNALTVASGVLRRYHAGEATITPNASRDVAASDVEAGLLACAGPITLTVVGTLATTGSTGWRTGQSVLVKCANASTVTIAAGSGQTLTAPNGAVLSGQGAVGRLTRVGTNSWLFVVVSGATFLPVAGINASGTASSATMLRGDGAWSAASPDQPWQWHVLPWQGWHSAVGSWAPAQASTYLGGGAAVNTPGAQNDEITWRVPVTSGGVYTFRLIYRQLTSSPILTVILGGQTLGTIDLYNASNVPNIVAELTGVTYSGTSGVQTLALVAADKNASSSGYRVDLHSVALIRTA